MQSTESVVPSASTRSYNLKDDFYELGNTPAFAASTSVIVEMLLDAGFTDMELVSERREGMPLLHYCVARGILTEAIARKLSAQVGQEWKGLLPIDYGTERMHIIVNGILT